MTEKKFKNQVADALRWYQKEHKKIYTQITIGNSIGLDNTTISKYLSEKKEKRIEIPLERALRIAEAMDTNLWTIMYLYEQQGTEMPMESCTNLNKEEKLKSEFLKIENLIVDVNDVRFKPWIGEYFCYFSSTSANEINKKKEECAEGLTEEQKELFQISPSNDHIFCGKMIISEDGVYCKVSLSFMADKRKHSVKHYVGKLYLSGQYAAGFIELSGQENGECSYIVLKSPDSGKLECRMAMVLTLSSIDGHRRACTEKILISKKKIEEETGEYEALKAYLRMNDSYIYIEKEEYEKLIGELKNMDVEELQKFADKYSDFAKLVSDNVTIEVREYASIPESIIQNLISKENKTKLCVCLRNHSMANWYYKANDKNAEDILNLINKKH